MSPPICNGLCDGPPDMIIFLIAVGISWYRYFSYLPQQVVLSMKLLILGAPAAFMVPTFTLAVLDVQVVRLSRVLLGTALVSVRAFHPAAPTVAGTSPGAGACGK
jgi:hypothetical protein